MTEERLKELLAEAVAQAAIQPELMKLKDVATMLSLSPPSVRRLVDAGEIPFVLYGRTRMYRQSFLAMLRGLVINEQNSSGMSYGVIVAAIEYYLNKELGGEHDDQRADVPESQRRHASG